MGEPDLWGEWERHEAERMQRARAVFAAGRGAEVLQVNAQWVDEATARQFALIAMDYALMGLYVAKEFCEVALARVIRAQGRHAELAASMTSPFDLRGELHPARLSASQLKTGMQQVEAYNRAQAACAAEITQQTQATQRGDIERVRYHSARISVARRKMRLAMAGERSERLVEAYARLQAEHEFGHGTGPALARAQAEVDEWEARETFALEKYTNIAAIRDFDHGDCTHLAPGVHAAYRAKLRDMLTCDDIIRIAGLPDSQDSSMMLYEVTGVRLDPDARLAAALRGIVRRGPGAFRAVRNGRADDTGRITSWEADLLIRRQAVGTLRLSTRSGMLHLTNLSAPLLREPIMRIRAPRPEQLRARA